MTTVHERPQTGAPDSSRLRPIPWLFVAAVLAVLTTVGAMIFVLAGNDGPLSGSTTTRGSGRAATDTRTVASFDGVELAGSTGVTIRVGTPQSVVVHADDNLLGHVRTTVRSGALVIETTGSFSTRTPMRVAVVVPELTRVVLSGSGRVEVDGVASSSFAAELSGSGTVQVAGRTDDLTARLPGSGQLDLADLVARSVQAQLSGSGEIEVNATDTLDAHVSGTGTITYAGHPRQVTRDVTGTGSVHAE